MAARLGSRWSSRPSRTRPTSARPMRRCSRRPSGLRARRGRPQLHGRHLGDPAGVRRRPPGPAAAHSRRRRGRAQLEPRYRPRRAASWSSWSAATTSWRPNAGDAGRGLRRARRDDGVVMVASARDIVDASGRPVVRGHGLGGLRAGCRVGRRSGARWSRREHLRRAMCVLLRRTTLEAVGGWHGDPGYLIDQATYCRVLLRGDLVPTPSRWPRSGSARPSGAFAGPRAGRLGRRDAPSDRRLGRACSARGTCASATPGHAARFPAPAGLPLPRGGGCTKRAGLLGGEALSAVSLHRVVSSGAQRGAWARAGRTRCR